MLVSLWWKILRVTKNVMFQKFFPNEAKFMVTGNINSSTTDCRVTKTQTGRKKLKRIMNNKLVYGQGILDGNIIGNFILNEIEIETSRWSQSSACCINT